MKPIYLLFIAVCFGAVGQISMKIGMNKYGAVASFSSKIFGALLSPYVLFGFLCYVVSSLLWLTILSQVKLSWAYPMLASSYLLIVFLSWLVLKEPVSKMQLVALLLIVVGVGLLSRTDNRNPTSTLQQPSPPAATQQLEP